MELMPHQRKALEMLEDGRVLYGGVGTGKGPTALTYAKERHPDKHIVIITTARKRDSGDYIGEALKLGIRGAYEVTVDSWNNIMSYWDYADDYFFIFDEQRTVGHGKWTKAFIHIARRNPWIMLSATPGDTWMDYAALFIANGWYKNITEFKFEHVKYKPFVRYPVIQAWLNVPKLEMYRNMILVEMTYNRHTERKQIWTDVDYDKAKFDRIFKDRWNIYEDRPLKDVSEMFRTLRQLVFSDPSRLEKLRGLMSVHDRLIVFYNYNYELEMLRTLSDEINVYEYNGRVKHQLADFEDEEEWLYLVQYQAGAEAWNCTSTNAMVLWSLNYSYRNHEQVQGRIDRLNTDFTELFYYIFVSHSFVCRGIRRALERKEDFNEVKFAKELADPDSFIEEGFGEIA